MCLESEIKKPDVIHLIDVYISSDKQITSCLIVNITRNITQFLLDNPLVFN